VPLDRWLTRLAWGCLAGYALFFFAFTNATLHTVDSVRDFEVAKSIARGEFFPTVSQPFAGRYQTPPAYFYLIAIPIKLGGAEHAVMLWIAALCFASILLLRCQLSLSFGRTVSNLYAITACVFPTSMFLHSISNASLAYAFSGLIAACLLALWRGDQRWSIPLVLALVLIIQMHLSSLPLVTVIGLTMIRFHRRMLSRGAWIVAMSCIALCGFWLMQYGYLASDVPSQEATSKGAAATGLAIVARLFSLSHWWNIASVYQQYTSALVDVPVWVRVCTAFLGVMVAFSVTVVCVAAVRDKGNGESERSVVLVMLFITGCTITQTVAYLTHWGLWYFDVLQPWIATLCALGLARVLLWVCRFPGASTRVSVSERIAFAAVCVAAVCNLLPQGWLHLRLAVHNEIVVRISGMFFPIHTISDQLVPLTSAGTQFAFRRWLSTRPGLCARNVVGSYEWLLRDMTLRGAYVDCREQHHVPNQSSPTLLATHARFTPTTTFSDALTLVWHRGNSRFYELPPQQISINGQAVNQLFGDQKISYGLYAPRRLLTGLSVAFAARNGHVGGHIGHIALRCINMPVTPTIVWRGDGGAAPINRLVLNASLLGLRYLEYEFELPLTSGNGVSDGMTVETIEPLECDVSAFTRPKVKP